MGPLRLSSLTHARHGIPWGAIGVVGAVPAVLILLAIGFNRSSLSWPFLQWGMLLWAATASFVLDDPAQPVVESTPRSPGWWHRVRLAAWVPMLVLPTSLALLWGWISPSTGPEVLGVSVQMVGASAVALAGAAVARRLGRSAPGDLIAGGAILVLLLLLINQFVVGEVALLPGPGYPDWGRTIRFWGSIGVVGLATVIVAARPFSWHRIH